MVMSVLLAIPVPYTQDAVGATLVVLRIPRHFHRHALPHSHYVLTMRQRHVSWVFYPTIRKITVGQNNRTPLAQPQAVLPLLENHGIVVGVQHGHVVKP